MIKPRMIVFLLYENVNVLDVTGPLEAFSQPCRMHDAAKAPYRIRVVSMAGGAVRTSSGLSLISEPISSLDGEAVDTLIIPGGGLSYQPFASPSVVDWIAHMAPRVRRLCSVCTGALALAQAGLLVQRRATTHWMASDELRRVEPRFVWSGTLFMSVMKTSGPPLVSQPVLTWRWPWWRRTWGTAWRCRWRAAWLFF